MPALDGTKLGPNHVKIFENL